MFGWTRGSVAGRRLAILLLALPAVTHSSQQSDATVTAAESFTKRFLAAAYPTLPAPRVSGAGRDGHASLDITFVDADEHELPSDRYLAGNASFEGRHMSALRMRGRYLSNPDLDQIQDLHSNSRFESLAAFEAELRRRGARYPPSALSEFVAAIDVERFRPVLGEFIADPEVRGPKQIGEVDWLVTLRTLEPNGQRMCYGLFFEPFNGRLAAVLALPMGGFKGAKLDECWPGK
jgi:hypothetical protein